MTIFSIFNIFRPYFLRRRQQAYYKIIRPLENDRILDVGGDIDFWKMDKERKSHITFVNPLLPLEALDEKQFSFIQGDGRHLPCSDKEYDIVFSNSTIEHVGTFEDQQRFADEIRRVGKRYWVQTPNRQFFLEPHLITPLIHYLPRKTQKNLIRYFTIWGLVTKPSKKRASEFIDSIRLLTRKEMESLFPDGSLYEERFLFWVKSFVAYKTSDVGRASQTKNNLQLIMKMVVK